MFEVGYKIIVGVSYKNSKNMFVGTINKIKGEVVTITLIDPFKLIKSNRGVVIFNLTNKEIVSKLKGEVSLYKDVENYKRGIKLC